MPRRRVDTRFERVGKTSLDALQPQCHRSFITAALPGAARAVGPHLEREVLLLGGDEAELEEERGLAREGEDLRQALAARLRDQGLEQRSADAPALVVRAHRHPRDFGEVARIDLERAAAHDGTVRRRGDDVLLDVPTQVVVAARQQVAGGDVGRHEPLQRGHVGKGGGTHDRRGRRPHDRERQRAHASTASSVATPRSSSSTETTSGGTSRITFGPALTTSKPRSRAAVTNGAAGSPSSTPHISPRPRTSRTLALRAASAERRRSSQPPLSRTAARKPGSAIVRSTSSATVATSGPPPNVVAWSPGLSAAAIAFVTSTAPIGSPPASGLASVTMSGSTPVCSYANSVPVRPSPHCTSSKTSVTPRASHSSRRKATHSGSTGRTPPSPCTGSTITAAVRDADTIRSAAAQSSSGTTCTPGTSGSNGVRYSGRSGAASEANRRPWEAPLHTTIFVLRGPRRGGTIAAPPAP